MMNHVNLQGTTPFMVISVTYTICKVPTCLKVSRVLIANMIPFINTSEEISTL